MQARYYSIKEYNRVLWLASGTIAHHAKALKHLDKGFRTEIMLAVTNVNGCSLCSYYHSKALLKSGATKEELGAVLASSYDHVDPRHYEALLFAEHYADVKGDYDPDAFERIKTVYGREEATGILAAIRMIMFGNVSGIGLTHLWRRITFRKVENGRFLTDLYNGLLANLLFPFLIIIRLFTKKSQ